MIKKTKKCCLLTVGALGLAAVVAAAVILKKEDIAFGQNTTHPRVCGL